MISKKKVLVGATEVTRDTAQGTALMKSTLPHQNTKKLTKSGGLQRIVIRK